MPRTNDVAISAAGARIRIMPGSVMRLVDCLGVAVAAAAFLVAVQVEVPNGDGRVYIHLIEAGRVVWNPNHLLMQPLGLGWCALLKGAGLHLSIFASLKLLSGISAVAALVIFNATLPVPSAGIRLLTTAALLFSAHFLSMAIAEEFYMIQMPVIAAIFGLALRVVRGVDPAREPRLLVIIGVLAALATGISINNALIAAALGPLLAFRGDGMRAAIRRTALVWLPGMAVGLPLILGAYVTSGSSKGLLPWLTSYQGASGSTTGSLYGVEWTAAGFALSAAKLPYAMVSSVALLGELGVVAEALIRSRPFEFTVNVPHVAGMLILFVAVGILMAAFLWWVLRAGRTEPIVRFSLGWLAAYLVFNFLFSDVSDQFWFQLLPPIWTMLALFVAESEPTSGGRATRQPWRPAVMAATVVLLAAANISSVVVPRAFNSIQEHQATYQRLIRDGDMVITTGWDDLAWMAAGQSQKIEKVLLMQLALQSRQDSSAVQRLPERVEAHLRRNGRVIVARVFDRDRQPRPWEQLDSLGWPRPQLQRLFAPYRTQVIGTIDSVVFRQLEPDATTARPVAAAPR